MQTAFRYGQNYFVLINRREYGAADGSGNGDAGGIAAVNQTASVTAVVVIDESAQAQRRRGGAARGNRPLTTVELPFIGFTGTACM